MSIRQDPDDPDVIAERASNRRYLELLGGSRPNLSGVAVHRSSVWLGTGLPKAADIDVAPLIGHVALDHVDPDIGAADFYIGRAKKQTDDIAVFSWLAPVADTFYRPSSSDYELCERVIATRTLSNDGDDVVGFVQDDVRPGQGDRPFQKRALSVPRAPSAPARAPEPSIPASSRPAAPAPPVRRTTPDTAEARPATAAPQADVPAARPVLPAPTKKAAAKSSSPPLRAAAAVQAAITSPRTARLTSTLATLQPDQYEYVTWSADQALVIQGNPGTGKTIVAAHRAAYLVSGERDRALRRVLLVGPTLGYKAHVSEVVYELATEKQVRVEGLSDLLERLRGLKATPGGALEGRYHEFDETIADDADMVAETLRDRDPSFNLAGPQQKVRRIYECLRANEVLGEPIAYVGEVARGYQSWPPFDHAARERRYIPALAACGLSAEIWKSRWFDHVIVDEAQDVRPLEWRLLQRMNRGKGWTIIGDVYQRRWDHSYRDWGTLVGELGLTDLPGGVRQVTIERGYRSTKQIMRFANQLLPAEGRRSESLQQDGPDPAVAKVAPKALPDMVLTEVIRLCDSYPDGTVAVIAPAPSVVEDKLRKTGWLRDQRNLTSWTKGDRRVACLGSEASRGLEFDAVVVVEPEDFPQNLGIRGQLYTSLTRANKELSVVHSKPLPDKMKARV